MVIHAGTTQLLTDRALPAGSAPHLAQCAEPGSQLSLEAPAEEQAARAPSSCSWLLMRSPLLKGDPILLTSTDPLRWCQHRIQLFGIPPASPAVMLLLPKLPFSRR